MPVSKSQYSLKANISQTVHPIPSTFGSRLRFSGSVDHRGSITNSIDVLSDINKHSTIFRSITSSHTGQQPCYGKKEAIHDRLHAVLCGLQEQAVAAKDTLFDGLHMQLKKLLAPICFWSMETRKQTGGQNYCSIYTL